nr:STAS domain-containing protein [Desulfobacula sp.]
MKIETHKDGPVMIVSVSGRLDTHTAGQFDEAMTPLAEAEKHLVIDFSNLEYISSAGLRSILIAAKKVRENQGNFALASLTQMVQDVFVMSGFSTIIRIYPDIPSACAGL